MPPPLPGRESLKRTPPGRNRSSSLTDVHWPRADPADANPSKRTRAEAGEDSNTGRDEFDEIVQRLLSRSKDLETSLKVCVNTKSEIKRAGADLLQLCIRPYRLNKSRPKCPSVRKADCATQADAPSVSTNSRIELRHETKDAGTQIIGADEEESERRRLALRRDFERSSTLDGLQSTMDLDWPKSVYERVKKVPGDVIAAPWDSDMVVFTTVDFQLSKGVARCFKKRFEGAAELRAQDAKISEVAYLINSITVPAANGNKKGPIHLVPAGREEPSRARQHRTPPKVRQTQSSSALHPHL
nr:unnamed protein product [Callosobruchus analis]